MASVEVKNIRVDFPVYGAQRSFRKVLFERATGGLVMRDEKRDRVVVRALTDVNLSLKDGDRIGLIGHNGSGKSTLLKTLAGIYEPISGDIHIDGKLTPLFDTLPGLDVEDTGYQNIMTAGMMFGMTQQRIEELLPEVEKFSELGEYLGLPVRTYSMGMMTRLGFAFATAIDPGILLMDEGIGAGDARFAERAEKRLKEFMDRSSIIVLASHSNALIRSICNKGALMQNGTIIATGSIDEVLEKYDVIVHGGTLPEATPVA
jgi:ABC-type polysaccharide/polyol phosphate transport system ATPase subunit